MVIYLEWLVLREHFPLQEHVLEHCCFELIHPHIFLHTYHLCNCNCPSCMYLLPQLLTCMPVKLWCALHLFIKRTIHDSSFDPFKSIWDVCHFIWFKIQGIHIRWHPPAFVTHSVAWKPSVAYNKRTTTVFDFVYYSNDPIWMIND